MILGLILAVVSAVATNLAFLFKHRGAVVPPPIRARHPLRSAVGPLRGAILRLSARTTTVGRRDDHRGRAARPDASHPRRELARPVARPADRIPAFSVLPAAAAATAIAESAAHQQQYYDDYEEDREHGHLPGPS